MPSLAEIVSATISVSHMMPSAYRRPTRMDGSAPGKITFLYKSHRRNPYTLPISISPGSMERMPCNVFR